LKTTCFCIFFFCTNEFSNYRILTPPVHVLPVESIGVRSHFLTNEFSNYRILTPPLPAFPVPRGDFFRHANYPFSTPRLGSTSDD